ncbi:MAG: hypothetical protein RSC34_00255, partial [Alistipes sp.]
MKTRSTLLLLAASTMLTACVDNALDGDRTIEVNKVAELSVPASFDWRLSNAVTCNTTSPKP